MELTLRARVNQLKKLRPQVEQKVLAACEGASMRAVEKAVELTPPTKDASGQGQELSGAHTRTGAMKESWAAASTTAPYSQGDKVKTRLANDMQYASYINDGHRMDRHFVPGLYINEESGQLEFDPSRKDVGILVGTKTTYVEGLHMVDAAGEEYKRVLREELEGIGEILE